MFDVVIVGGSVAGLNCAYFSALYGLDVAVVEKKSEIGIPVQCGEAIPYHVLEDNWITPRDDFIASEVKRVRMFTPKGKELVLDLKYKRGLVLNRDIFEKHLSARAYSMGARILLGRKVMEISGNSLLLSDDEIIRGRIIVGADGYGSIVGKTAGIYETPGPKDRGVCSQYYLDGIDIEEGEIEVHWGWRGIQGYGWVFSKGDHRANLGVGVLGGGSRHLLKAFKKWRSPESRILRTTGGIVPLARPPPTLAKGHFLLIGDAGNLAFPHHGGGIGNAMLSGKIAGMTMGHYWEHPKRISYEYDKAIKKALYKKLHKCYRLKEKVMVRPNKAEWYLKIGKVILFLHKLFPKWVEERGLRNLRY